MEKGDASLAALKAAGTRDKKSPLVLADEDVGKGAFFSAGGDHHRDAGARGHPGGSQLGLHAADGGGARCAASQFLDVGIDLLDDRDRAWLFLPKVFHQAIDGGEDDEQVGRQQAGNQRRKPIVVAKFQLGVADGVVLVDDRYDALVKQRDKGIAGVEVAVLVLEVVVRKEHLGDLHVVSGKQFRVGGHKLRLANGGAGLQVGQVGGALVHSEHAHAGADGAGRHDNDLPAGLALGCHLGDQLLYLAGIDLFAAAGQNAGAKLDHHAAGFF